MVEGQVEQSVENVHLDQASSEEAGLAEGAGGSGRVSAPAEAKELVEEIKSVHESGRLPARRTCGDGHIVDQGTTAVGSSGSSGDGEGGTSLVAAKRRHLKTARA